MSAIDLGKYEVRTDLISESLSNIDDYKREVTKDKDITIETIMLDNDKAQMIGKKAGVYKTISFLDATDEDNYQDLLAVVVKEIKKMLDIMEIKDNYSCLIIGLGNRKSTADAIGPLMIDKIKITRQIVNLKLPLSDKYRVISSFVPGVMGVTGIETSDIIVALKEKVKPDFMIVVDSLKASVIDRVNKTIQLTNTGITPGSGLLSNREEISEEILKIPVLAIGVPTVLEAATIVSNTINYLYKHFSYEKENINNQKLKLIPVNNRNYKDHQHDLSTLEKEKVLGLLGSLKENELEELIKEVLIPLGYNYLVTPKDIDEEVLKLSSLLADAINKSLLIK